MRLSHKDYDAVQEAIFDLYKYRDLQRFRREIPAIFLKIIPSEYFFWPEYRIDPAAAGQEMLSYVESSPTVTPDLARRMAKGILFHPFTQYFVNGGEHTALKISDFLTQTQFRATRIYDVYREWGFKYNMSIPINAPLGQAAGIGLCDAKRDFTERDRFVLNLLRRHFEQAHRNAKLATHRLASPAKSLASFGLTPREAEISHWVAAGKTNAEIGVILQCAARTVEKHMERILEKLEVENRSGVAATVSLAGGKLIGELTPVNQNGPANGTPG